MSSDRSQLLAYCNTRSHFQRQAVSTSISLPLVNCYKS
ncbi:hypothetical protein GXM_08945 [Nostoc sphaeroides CCNUC1]|uniref:Uncharacterized protein n=1 Tax=Nostoc sphaeroides CCNUC1 TaxID=2653204 RepID=A0A5P8WFV8_9NOSO|nr:hypothetical protein GXM_08945 [Nostoc sphaeroides CCNUC1]